MFLHVFILQPELNVPCDKKGKWSDILRDL